MFHDIAGHEQLTQDIIGCAIRVHEAFGPGLFESIYKQCLVIDLKTSGLEVDTTRRIPLTYRGHDIDAHFCPDIIVDNTVIVELKGWTRSRGSTKPRSSRISNSPTCRSAC